MISSLIKSNNDLLRRNWFDEAFGESVSFSPKFEIIDDEKSITVLAELPGMNEKDINVDVTDNVLTISGEKKNSYEEKKNGYYKSERQYGSFSRNYVLAENIDVNKIKATYEKGVLKLELPKKNVEKPSKKILIETKD